MVEFDELKIYRFNLTWEKASAIYQVIVWLRLSAKQSVRLGKVPGNFMGRNGFFRHGNLSVQDGENHA